MKSNNTVSLSNDIILCLQEELILSLTQKDPFRANQNFEKILEDEQEIGNFNYSQVLSLIDKLLDDQSLSKEIIAEIWFLKGHIFYVEQNYFEAFKCFQEASRLDITNTKYLTFKKKAVNSHLKEFEIPFAKLTINEEAFGRDSSSNCYEGRLSDKPIIVKKPFSINIMEETEEMKEEAVYITSLQHPNIINCFGISKKNDNAYLLIFEFTENGSLHNYLQNGRPLLQGERWQIALDTARGLQYLHDNEIVHLNIKSLNILLDQSLRAKISDFGTARFKPKQTAEVVFSLGIVGTPYCIAPETFSKKIYSKECDMYAYALVLWEIAANKFPYQSEEWSDFFTFAIKVERGDREIIPDDFPREVAKIITECWDQKPQKRLSAAQVVERLSNLSFFTAKPLPEIEAKPKFNLSSSDTSINQWSCKIL